MFFSVDKMVHLSEVEINLKFKRRTHTKTRRIKMPVSLIAVIAMVSAMATVVAAKVTFSRIFAYGADSGNYLGAVVCTIDYTKKPAMQVVYL